MTTQPELPTESDLWQALHDAMDGNLRQSKRRERLDAYKNAVQGSAALVDAQARAELCAEGDCPNAHQATRHEKTAGGYRYALEEAHDYLDDGDALTADEVATLRGILARALDA